VPTFGGVAQAVTSTSFFLSSAPVKVGTTGYKMRMFVSSGFLQISLAKTATTGHHPTQTHTYIFFPPGALSCNGTTMNCTIDTGTSMANSNRDYGRINETFTHSSKKTVTNKCKNGTIIGSTTTAPGVLTGLWHLKSFNSFFGDLTNAGAGKIPNKIPATATKSFSNGNTCPTPPPGPTPCSQSLSLNASVSNSSTGTSRSFSASHSLPTGTTFESFGFSEGSATTSPAFISHSIFAFGGPQSSLTAVNTLNSGHVDADWARPYLTGDDRFARTKPVTKTSSKCAAGHHIIAKTALGKVTGDVTAHWNGLGKMPLGNLTDHSKTAPFTPNVSMTKRTKV